MEENKIFKLGLGFKIFIFIFILILSLIFTLSIVRIKDIKVKGNSWYTDSEIENLVFPTNVSRNSLLALVDKALNRKKSIPFVQDYSINFESPFSVELIIYEKSMVAGVEYMSSYLYFDKDGIVVESSAKKLDNIPVVKNLKTGDVVLYKKLPVENTEIFNDILNITQVLSVKGIKTEYIEYNSDKTVNLMIGEIRVELGEIYDLNSQISALMDILPKLKGLKGDLYLDTYNDNNSKGMYTFKKK